MDLDRECVAKQYKIKVDLKLIEDSDFYKENKNQWDEILSKKLDKIKGLNNVDYNGHFGPYIWLTIETECDTSETWSEIEKFINEAYHYYKY